MRVIANCSVRLFMVYTCLAPVHQSVTSWSVALHIAQTIDQPSMSPFKLFIRLFFLMSEGRPVELSTLKGWKKPSIAPGHSWSAFWASWT